MGRIFQTSRTKEEICFRMRYIMNNYDKYVSDKSINPIRIVGESRIRVSLGRSISYWDLDFETQGEIEVRRHNTILDCVMIFMICNINLILAFLTLYSRFSVRSLLVLSIVFICEYIPANYLSTTYLLKKIEGFLETIENM